MLKKQMMFPLAYVLIVAMVLVGCAAQPVPSATGQQAEDQQAMEAEKELVIVQGTEPWTMDMQWVTAQVIVNVGNHIQQTLLDYDHSMTLQPNLAVSWEQIEPTVWQYKLREGVQFSNGEPFNADQVKFSFDRVMAPDSDSMRKGETRYVSSVEVVDDYTVNFHTDGIIPLFDLYVTAKFPIVPEAYITENDAEHFASNPIGTGPYVLEEWVKDDHITLRKNPTYWGEEPKIDVITFLTVPDIASRGGHPACGRGGHCYRPTAGNSTGSRKSRRYWRREPTWYAFCILVVQYQDRFPRHRSARSPGNQLRGG